LSRRAALALVHEAVLAGRHQAFGFCNAHTVNMARQNKAFAEALAHMTLLPDGIGVDLASKALYGAPFPENLNGTDFTPDLLASAPAPLSIFLLGSAPGIAAQAASRFAARYPGITVAGHHHGYFSEDEAPKIAHMIRQSGAQLILVGMGHPRQELWAARHGPAAGGVVLTVGALFDFVAGRFARAPLWMRKARCEWMFRLMCEPKRMARRYLIGNFTFLSAVLQQSRERNRHD
jgi:exopolysaccharide biosynthesis WecB/TagA/CpsF family protein